MNSLRFGPLDDPNNRHLFNGVVGGISWYGNCIGVPDVGGEIAFSKTYSGNPLVNALCVGLVQKDKLVSATVGSRDNLLILTGSATGRDGIHGASTLASRTFESDEEMRPTVQVGNPFLEKVLIEACLEAAATGALVGLQDLGAAGLSGSTIEAADRGGQGIRIDVSQVHRREDAMTPYEVMLSESQERMLLIVKPESKDTITAILEKWDLPWIVLGDVEGRKPCPHLRRRRPRRRPPRKSPHRAYALPPRRRTLPRVPGSSCLPLGHSSSTQLHTQ